MAKSVSNPSLGLVEKLLSKGWILGALEIRPTENDDNAFLFEFSLHKLIKTDGIEATVEKTITTPVNIENAVEHSALLWELISFLASGYYRLRSVSNHIDAVSVEIAATADLVIAQLTDGLAKIKRSTEIHAPMRAKVKEEFKSH